MKKTKDRIEIMKQNSVRRIITLLTDFGTRDYYVSSMKGVILSIAPNAIIIDITHEVEPFNVLQAAFLLYQAVRWFPTWTIHVAVVDPGVGSERKPLAIKTRKCVLIGPDNGVLMPAANYFGIIEVREIRRKFFECTSHTFHGRDVFAPAAANLVAGMKLEELGPVIRSPKKLDFGDVKWIDNGIEARVLHVDRFGNLITNIPTNLYHEITSKEKITIIAKGKTSLLKPASSYFEGKPKEFLILPGSEDFIEISLNKGSAAKFLNIKPGDTFILKFGSSF